MRGSKPKRGFFKCIDDPSLFRLYILPKVENKFLELAKKHDEKVEAQGPINGCGCSRCLDARRTEFTDLYGEKT